MNKVLVICISLIVAPVNAWSIFKPSTWFKSETLVEGSGNLQTKTFATPGISKIEAWSIGTIIIIQDSNAVESVTIEADDNIVPYVEVVQSGDVLQIGTQSGVSINTTLDLVCTVTVKDITKITLSGAVTMDIQQLVTSAVEMDLSGAARLHGEIVVARCDLLATGCARIVLTGKATEQNIVTSGTSTINASQLSGVSANIDSSGTSNVYVNVTESVTGQASGTSSITYQNNPKKVAVQTSGLSSLSKA